MSRHVETWLITAPQPVFEVILDVVRERSTQDEKWGEQSHTNGTGPDTLPLYDGQAFLDDDMTAARLAEIFKRRTDERAATGVVTYTDILLEELFEALAESDPRRLRTELVQVAAVAAQWIEKLDREAGQ